MKNASGNSWPISVYPPLPGLIEGTPSNNSYKPGFSAGMMNKDLKLANDCAKKVNALTPLGEKALEIYDNFCKEGNNNKVPSFGSIFCIFAENSVFFKSNGNLFLDTAFGLLKIIFPQFFGALT